MYLISQHPTPEHLVSEHLISEHLIAEDLVSENTTPHSLVAVTNLALSFGNNIICQGIALSLLTGKNTTLLGRSGVGKSSLLRVIAGLDDSISVTGVITKPVGLSIAYLPQQDSLYPWLSVLDNTQLSAYLFGKKNAHSTQQAYKYLELVGLTQHIHSNVSELSGGQRQRVALARVLLQNADLILMDEPFSALDEITKYELLEFAQQLFADKTVMMITHNPSEALQFSDKIFVLTTNTPPIVEVTDFATNPCAYEDIVDILAQRSSNTHSDDVEGTDDDS